MTIELNTELLETEDINLNQLIFLALVLGRNQKLNQDTQRLLSQISEVDIQELMSKELVISIERDNSKVYKPSKKLTELISQREKSWFDRFYELYPIYVTRNDGTKGFLRANVSKCRVQFNQIVGKSEEMSQHLYDCLKFQIDNYSKQGKLGYMKTMWKWLVNHEWEAIEDEMSYNNSNTQKVYGTELI